MQSCPNCGAQNADDARFCSQCATPLVHSADERKLVTVLFADITGSTGLGEKLDPETLKDVMNTYFSAMSEEIEAEGGTVEKFIGDAVMAAFGVPVAHEDDPARALRAALRMKTRLQQLNETLQQQHALTLQMRIGVNTGEAMASTTPGQTQGMVSGDAVNVAARLEQAAEPGEIVVAERTARATRGFEFGQAKQADIRGRAEAVQALTLIATTEATPIQERGIPGIRAPMVGRDRELDLLRSLFDRVAQENRAHLVTIYGDPGIGKSRLVREFLDAIPTATKLFGRCLPYGEGVTYWPLAEILKSQAHVLDSDPAAEAQQKIKDTALKTLTGVHDPERSAAALAFAIGLDDPRFHDLPPRQIRLETHEAWRAFFAGLAATQPVVAVVEDIHWADGALLDLLEELAERTPGPVLFLCPARHELTQRRPTWGGGKRNFSSISLDPLTQNDAEQLVDILLAIDDLPPAVRDQILARAEGNPFFLEEIIRQLIDEGRIVHTGDHWRAAAEIGDAVIPDTVQGVLAARIDLLEPNEKRALQSAAVVGRVFWTGPVAKLLNGDADTLDDTLWALEGRELIVSRLGSAVAGDREYIFKHVLTRDVAYGSLPRRERGAAHARVAEWIEEAAGERRREFADLLAHHYSSAYERALADRPDDVPRLRAKTFEYLLMAAGEARNKMLLERSNDLTQRALDMAETIQDRAAAHESLGMTALFGYQGDDAWRWLTQAVDELIESGTADPQHIAMLCARAVEVPTRWPASLTDIFEEPIVRPYLEKGFAASGDSRNEGKVRLLLAKAFAPFAFRTFSDDADEVARIAGNEARTLARDLGRTDLESAALDALGAIESVRGKHSRVAPINAARLELAKVLIDPWEAGDTYQMAADGELAMGHYRAALQLANDGWERARESPVGGSCLAWRALAKYRLGDWDGMIADMRELEVSVEAIAYWWQPITAAGAAMYQLRGNETQAKKMIDAVVPEPGKVGLPRAVANCARTLALQGEGERAWALLDWPWKTKTFLSAMLEAECDVVEITAAWERTPATLARAREHGEESGVIALWHFADRLEGRAALAAGDAAGAIDPLVRARDGFASLGARWDEAASALSLGEALITTGDQERARAELSAALAVFDDLGSVKEAARARAALG